MTFRCLIQAMLRAVHERPMGFSSWNKHPMGHPKFPNPRSFTENHLLEIRRLRRPEARKGSRVNGAPFALSTPQE